MKDPFREELEAADGTPNIWEPQPGDILIGKLVSIHEVEGEYGPTRVAEILDEDTGRIVTVWLSREVLRRAFDVYAPKPGERVGIKYHGLKDGRRTQYHSYTVRVERVPTPTGDKEERMEDLKEIPGVSDPLGDAETEVPF